MTQSINICDMIREQPDGEDEDTDELDPRVEIELENLNQSSNDINILEKKLDEARASFRQQLTDAVRKLKSLSDNLGNNIDKARPYFEAKNQAKKAQQECQNAAMVFERACQLHKGARETVSVAEDKLMMNPGMFDPAWQEMLNNANIKIMEAEKEKLLREVLHHDATITYTELENRATQLEKQLKKSIRKARPYFEQKIYYLGLLETQKQRVQALEKEYRAAKSQYATSLRNLEAISEDIHRKRNENKAATSCTHAPSAIREEGVGAEMTTDKLTTRRRSLQRRASEEHIKKALSRHHSGTHRDRMSRFRSARFRSSFLMDLDVDIESFDDDVNDCGVEGEDFLKSPSTKSVDIGCVNMKYYDDYQLLDVAPFLERERRQSRSGNVSLPAAGTGTTASLYSTLPNKQCERLKLQSMSNMPSNLLNKPGRFNSLGRSQSENERRASTDSMDIISSGHYPYKRNSETQSSDEFEVISPVGSLDSFKLMPVTVKSQESNLKPVHQFSMIPELDADKEENDTVDNSFTSSSNLITDQSESRLANSENIKTDHAKGTVVTSNTVSVCSTVGRTTESELDNIGLTDDVRSPKNEERDIKSDNDNRTESTENKPGASQSDTENQPGSTENTPDTPENGNDNQLGSTENKPGASQNDTDNQPGSTENTPDTPENGNGNQLGSTENKPGASQNDTDNQPGYS